MSAFAAAAAAAAAKNTAALDDEAVLEEYEGSDYEQWCSIVYLEELTSLTRLTINVTEFECNEVFWPCIGKLQTLRNLDIRGLDMYFGGIVVLTSCQELTSLRTCSSDGISRLNMQVRQLHTATPPIASSSLRTYSLLVQVLSA